MSLDQDFSNRIAQIKDRFAAALAGRVREFKELRQRIEHGADAEDALNDLRLGVHKLRGVAPTLGFARIGELAGQSEDCINVLSRPEKPSDAAAQFFGSLDSLLSEMEMAGTRCGTLQG